MFSTHGEPPPPKKKNTRPPAPPQEGGGTASWLRTGLLRVRGPALGEEDDEDQELAIVLGFGSVSMMKNKLGDEYVEKSIRRLLERAEEMEREKNERNELFKNGKLYYERGACVDSVHPGTFSLPLVSLSLSPPVSLCLAHALIALTRSSCCSFYVRQACTVNPRRRSSRRSSGRSL